MELAQGDFVLELAPEVGGAIARFAWRGRELLRRAPPDFEDALQAACFPLAPFANRIAEGRFRFGGREVRLAPGLPGHPHALHGQAWRRPWRIEQQRATGAVLAYEHPAGEVGWPWPYRVRQDFVLTGSGLRVELELTNLAAQAMPAGLGFHPYFPLTPTARLKARVAGVWLAAPDRLPTVHVAEPALGDWSAGVDLPAALDVDHCHTGWDGSAWLEVSGLGLRMLGSPDLSWLHIFTPPGADYFCAEPVSHRPDAINAPDPAAQGLRVLAPGQSWTVRMDLDLAGPLP